MTFFVGPNFSLLHSSNLFPSNGELWLGLEYMFWVQTAHGINGTKLCNFIRGPSPSMDPQNYKYVCYDQFQIGDVGTDYAILTAGLVYKKIIR